MSHKNTTSIYNRCRFDHKQVSAGRIQSVSILPAFCPGSLTAITCNSCASTKVKRRSAQHHIIQQICIYRTPNPHVACLESLLFCANVACFAIAKPCRARYNSSLQHFQMFTETFRMLLPAGAVCKHDSSILPGASSILWSRLDSRMRRTSPAFPRDDVQSLDEFREYEYH